MNKKAININEIIPFLYTFAAIIVLYAPYQFDSTLGSDFLRNILKYVLYVVGLMGFLYTFSLKIKRGKFSFSTIFYICAYLILFFLNSFHSYNGNLEITGILTLLLCVGFCLSDEDKQKKTFVIFSNIWLLICIISILCYLSYTLNFFIPYSIKDYYSLVKGNVYIDYGVSFIYKSGEIIRICGICNEPGFHGTITALFLCASNYNLKEKKNIVFLVSGILTFSVAFAFITFIYLLLKSWKNWKVFFLMIILFVSYIAIIPNMNFNNTTLNRFVDRISIGEDGIKGDNRSNESLDIITRNTIKEYPIFGRGSNYIRSLNIRAVSSYKVYIVEYGIVGCILMWGLLLLSVTYKNKGNIYNTFFLILFFLSIYQRPNIFILPYQILLLGGTAYIKIKKDVIDDKQMIINKYN